MGCSVLDMDDAITCKVKEERAVDDNALSIIEKTRFQASPPAPRSGSTVGEATACMYKIFVCNCTAQSKMIQQIEQSRTFGASPVVGIVFGRARCITSR